MQSNPRILANSLVILVKILVNLLVKLTKLGGHGGANPLRASLGESTESSQHELEHGVHECLNIQHEPLPSVLPGC